ncbi:hypothetical protein JCGZ_24060 [Jatropha curcas]|uniref:Glycosyltransferase n=1 Tax=Jatropha curcas TaxID=180498 RepID=A0A067LEF5_JATCU|nr:UDP-glycosyltransferase 84B1 [Jatropha curcas]KDP46851.1 hypothetical protein JCGZ_24060 [Jatropha curcas]
MVAEAEQVSILMVTMALQGHMNPMLSLAKRLVSKGIHITIAINDVARHRMLKSKASTALSTTTTDTTSKPPGIDLVFYSDGLSPEFDRDSDVDLTLKSLRTVGSENLSNIITNSDKKFSCIICNPFMPWMPDIAEKHGIPCAVLWIQACLVYSIYYHFFKYANSFPSLENPNESIELPGLPVLQVKDLPSFIFPSSPEIFKKIVSEFLQKLDKVQWVLVNSFTELEEETVKSMNCYLHHIFPIGPLVSPFLFQKQEENIISNIDMWNSNDNACIEWLDKRPPSSVIYISFGTITLLSQTQMENLAIALENSQKPFLWVIKAKENCFDHENRGSELFLRFLEETKDRGMVVTWCPQDKVLMHKAIGCFFTHCGWNSSLEAVVAGVPVIAYPGWTDQPTVAKLLVDVLKIGVRIKVEEEGGEVVASADEIKRSILEITDGEKAEEIKKNVVELRERAKKVVADGGSSNENLDLFIKKITLNSSCFLKT